MLWMSLLACHPEPSLQWLVAASAGPAAHEVAASFPGTRVAVSAASSSVLARQIQAGAEAQLFLSANPAWADALSPVVDRIDLVANRVVVVSAVDAAPWPLEGAPSGCVAVGDPAHVPVGVYARTALADRWDELEAHLVPVVDAPAAVRAVQAGACPHAMAYETDAGAHGVRVDAVLDVEVRYPLVLLSDRADARALYDWVTAPAAAEVFARHGFVRIR